MAPCHTEPGTEAGKSGSWGMVVPTLVMEETMVRKLRGIPRHGTSEQRSWGPPSRRSETPDPPSPQSITERLNSAPVGLLTHSAPARGRLVLPSLEGPWYLADPLAGAVAPARGAGKEGAPVSHQETHLRCPSHRESEPPGSPCNQVSGSLELTRRQSPPCPHPAPARPPLLSRLRGSRA